jgi:hypothetical protein
LVAITSKITFAKMHNLEQVEGPVTYKGKQHIDLQSARIKNTHEE